MKTPELDLGALTPLIVVALGAVLLPLLDVLLGRTKSFLSRPVTAAWAGTVLSLATAAVLLIALVSSFDAAGSAPRVFNPAHPMIVMDGMTNFLNTVVLIGALLTALASSKFLADLGIERGEYYALLLASVLGMMLLIASTDLMMLFVGLELMSIPIYAMAGLRRESLRSNESALKYFLVGSFASAILLYGSALIYGATGTVSLAEIGTRFDADDPILLIGSGLLLVGLGFKIASVPFHQWAPDVYEGAPTTVSGLMATTVKVAAFGILIRVLTRALGPIDELLYGALWVTAVLTMTVGNVMAIIQQNTKRMLAYSSVAHAGYLLVGIVVGTQAGISAVLFYLLAYTFMTLGAFGVVAVLAHGGQERERIEDLAGLGNSRVFLAVVMTICMISLAGIPGTAGFMGKFYIFRAAVEQALATGHSSLIWLAVIGVLNSAVSLVYYMRLPMVMFMREAEPGHEPDRPGTFEGLVLLVCAAAVVLLGLWPEDLNLILTHVDVLHWASLASASP